MIEMRYNSDRELWGVAHLMIAKEQGGQDDQHGASGAADNERGAQFNVKTPPRCWQTIAFLSQLVTPAGKGGCQDEDECLFLSDL